MDSKFLRTMTNLMDLYANRSDDNNSPGCVSAIDHCKFYQFCLIPSVVFTFLMALSKRRRQLLLHVFYGRPGLVSPVDGLTSSATISYCCAFGATVVLVYQIVVEQTYAINYDGSVALGTLVAIVSMLIYGMVYFPVFACLALRTAFSYAFGTLHVWILFSVVVYQLTECNYSLSKRRIHVARALPSLACLGYLSVSLPLRFGIACSKRRFFNSRTMDDCYCETMEEIKRSHQGIHVQNLLKKPESYKEPPVSVFSKIIRSCIYHSHKGFQYPAMLTSVMFTGLCVVYMITVEFLTSFIAMADLILAIQTMTLEQLSTDQTGNCPGNSSYTDCRNRLLFIYNITYMLKVCIIVAVVTAAVFTFVNILDMMASFRRHMYAMYRGDYSNIPPASKTSAGSLCVGSIEFGGFQVAFIIWGYVTQCIVLFLINAVLAVIIFSLKDISASLLANALLKIWPSATIALALMAIQTFLTQFVFLQRPAKYLFLNNRRFLFIYTYFMFFFNIFLGLFSCSMRVIKAVVIGTMILSRLDNSTLPRKFESYDPGFSAYQGYIHVQAAQSNPVVNVFVRILASLTKSTNDEKHFSEKGRREFSARFNWHVLYTLLHNPTVRLHRKGYLEALKKARKTGLKIPISDKPITDFDLVKAQQKMNTENTVQSDTDVTSTVKMPLDSNI